jgi:hypothetical protein
MTTKEPKYLTDFFIYNKRYHWFIIPTVVFFYRRDVFFETGLCTPAFGFSVRWLTFFMGVQFQRNAYYNKNGI